MKLSIIIPTYRREHILCDTIDSVLKGISDSKYSKDIELAIIDQTKEHTEDVSDFLKQIATIDSVTYVYEPKANLPNARNVGLKHTTGEIVCYLDDDIILHDGFVDKLIERYDNSQIMSVVGQAILKNQNGENILLDSQGGVKKILRSVITKIICINKASVITPFGIQLSNRDSSAAMRADAGRGCCMSFRRVVFDYIGMFDINYIGNALREETDFFYRMKTNNMTVFFDPDIVLDHIMANVGGCRNEQKEAYWKTFFDNQFYFFRKNYNFPRWYIQLLLFFDVRTLKKNGFDSEKIIEESYCRAEQLLRQK